MKHPKISERIIFDLRYITLNVACTCVSLYSNIIIVSYKEPVQKNKTRDFDFSTFLRNIKLITLSSSTL